MTLTIDGRYNGPPGSGNGGYVAGRLAEELLGPDAPGVEVTLRSPPPLDRPMTVSVDDACDGLTAGDHDTLVATARRLPTGPPGAELVDPVALPVAEGVQATYLGLQAHPFPTCWVCGPSRPDHDGYDLRPGRLGDGRTGCVWTVQANVEGVEPSVPASAVWAALDCPGAWTALDGSTSLVLGRISAQVKAVPAVGDRCVVMGRLLGSDGRKTFTATTVYGSAVNGTVAEPLGTAVATWIAIG